MQFVCTLRLGRRAVGLIYPVVRLINFVGALVTVMISACTGPDTVFCNLFETKKYNLVSIDLNKF